MLERHLARWLSPFWALDGQDALALAARRAVADVFPAPGEQWRRKLSRQAVAIRNARLTNSEHRAQLARRKRERVEPPGTA